MITLNSGQNEAVGKIINFISKQDREKLFLLEGSAGTGKTTCINSAIKELNDLNWVLTAPTNKATKVLMETSKREGVGDIDCRTIYSLLGLRVVKDAEYVRVEALADSEVQNYNVVVIDEGSMMSKSLMGFVFEAAAATHTKFVFMLDSYQLPPVGEEKSEACDILNKHVLSKVERHDNQILTFANYLRDCIDTETAPKFKTDKDENGGVYTVDFRRLRKHLEKAYTSENYKNNSNSCKTVAWRNSSVGDYNDYIRGSIYGSEANEKFVRGERVVACHPIPTLGADEGFDMVTDEEGTVEEISIVQHPMWPEFKVYHLRIEAEFSNLWADCFVPHEDSMKAYNLKLNHLASEAKHKKLPWSSFWALKNEFMHDIRPCHAITAHRSQGSTYRSCFVDAEDIMSNYTMPEALKCLYVASTRASTILVLKTR